MTKAQIKGSLLGASRSLRSRAQATREFRISISHRCPVAPRIASGRVTLVGDGGGMQGLARGAASRVENKIASPRGITRPTLQLVPLGYPTCCLCSFIFGFFPAGIEAIHLCMKGGP